MAKSSMARLENNLQPLSSTTSVWILGTVAGLLFPVLLLTVGWTLELLSHVSPRETLSLGSWIQLPRNWFGEGQSSLFVGSVLLGIGLLVAMAQSVALWILNQQADVAALDHSLHVFRAVFQKSSQLALVRSVLASEVP